MTWIGILFVILVIWAIFGGGFGNGNGWGNHGGDYASGGCNRVSNCEVEKSEIIDSARTQYLIEQQSAATRTAVRDGTEANMLTRPNLYGVASTCSGQIIPASFGRDCGRCGSNNGWNNNI